MREERQIKHPLSIEYMRSSDSNASAFTCVIDVKGNKYEREIQSFDKITMRSIEMSSDKCAQAAMTAPTPVLPARFSFHFINLIMNLLKLQ